MFENFTHEAIKTILLATKEGRRLGHNFVGTEQLLLGLIEPESRQVDFPNLPELFQPPSGKSTDIADLVLSSLGVTLEAARIEVDKIIGRGSGDFGVEIPFTPRTKRIWSQLSVEESHRLGHNYIGTEHLLLGLDREGEGVAFRVLQALGVELQTIRPQVIRMLNR